uniref:MYND-type domain-containing protein n=1 Tax=Hyaloperonospora arabidopsidis (strain Emoy2) TaxID=559515 RepID=M4B7I7_HYAAE
MTADASIVAPSCLSCGKADAKSRCGGCRRVHFCDRECQRQSWRSHRVKCLNLSRIPSEPTRVPCPSIQTEGIQAATKSVVSCITEPKQSPPKQHKKAHKKQHKQQQQAKKQHKRRSNSVHVLPSAATSAATSALLLPHHSSLSPLRKNRSVSLGAKKHVIWGDVSAREFARFPGGGGAVPYDGTWALGLGHQLSDVALGSVLERERRREQTLQDRVELLSRAKRRDVREGETRQFDYRRGVENPLFARLSEEERKRVFALVKEEDEKDLELMEMGPISSSETRLASPLHWTKPSRRKNSTASTASLDAFEEGTSGDDAAWQTPDFGCVSIEQLDEFTRIRDSRDGACGCSCGDLVKKVAKMNVKKLRAFLQERQVKQLPGMGKTELMAAAKKLAREQKNCQSTDSDCECARNGVPCHSDVCEGCAGDCCNPFQRYVYKSVEVQQYRKEQLAKYQQLQGNVQQPDDVTASVCVD